MVARVAEVAAFIPGPVGTVAGFVSAGAYLATGNTRKAAEMALTGAANMIGAGLAVRGAFKVAGVAAKIGRKAASVAKRASAAIVSCGRNSFSAMTLVLMADGNQIPIADVAVGDVVWAEDPLTGVAGPRAVTGLIRSGGLHLMVDVEMDNGETIEATDLHPLWFPVRGSWVDAVDVVPGDVVQDASGESVLVVGVSTHTEGPNCGTGLTRRSPGSASSRPSWPARCAAPADPSRRCRSRRAGRRWWWG